MSTDNLLHWPTQTNGARVPYGVFTDREWYVREQATVFRGETWSFVALEAEIPKPGDFKSTFVGDTPVVVTRDTVSYTHLRAHET